MECIKVPMKIFSVNFRPENYSWTLLSITEGESMGALRRSGLIEKLAMLKMIHGKVSLILAIPVVRPSSPQSQVPRQSPLLRQSSP